MKDVFLPKGKALIKVFPRAEQENGFYLPESNRNENTDAILVRISSEYEKETEGLTSCIVRKDAGVEIDGCKVFPTDSSFRENDVKLKVVDVQNDILIIY